MPARRSLALDQLKTDMDALTPAIATVEIANDRPDITIKNKDTLPLIAIVPQEESPEPYEVGRHALWRFTVELTCYFLDDIDSETQQETLTKLIKDAIGGDPDLDGKCVEIRITGIRRGGEFPLWEITFTLEIVYEQKISDA